MTLNDLKNILNATVLNGEDYMYSREITSAFASDFMSDVLAFVSDQDVLLTGMVNPQVVRTAQMMDMKCIVFVRGKMPDDSIIDLATKNNIIVMMTEELLYNSCGMLYAKGLKG